MLHALDQQFRFRQELLNLFQPQLQRDAQPRPHRIGYTNGVLFHPRLAHWYYIKIQEYLCVQRGISRSLHTPLCDCMWREQSLHECHYDSTELAMLQTLQELESLLSQAM